MKNRSFQTRRLLSGVRPNGGRVLALVVGLVMAGALSGCGAKSSSGGGGGGLISNGNNGTTPQGTGTWAWESGSKTANQNGSFGTLGVAAAGNVPGGRLIAANFTDTAGNMWVFGGTGYDSVGTAGGTASLNDLWKYSPSSGQWAWMSGAKLGNAQGVYGTLNVAAAANVPGARSAPTFWTDNSGNFWIFGGGGYDVNGLLGYLNDMWKYTPSTGMWTWVGGSNVVSSSGTFGTLKTPAAGNVPSARKHAVTWVDGSGNLWLFGGIGCDSTGSCGNYLNDLWEYNIGTGQWAWMSGSKTAGQSGTYGTMGTAAAGNIPGARNVAVGWSDGKGNLYMFGGNGYDSIGTAGGNAYLNDMWKYNTGSQQWTWLAGSNTANATGSYGTVGVVAASNEPAARWGSYTFIDPQGNLWLFGGYGNNGEYNDAWVFATGSSEWTFEDGDNTTNNDGIYGTQGSSSTSNIPGGRERGAIWLDSAGNAWLFGGEGYDSVGTGNGTGYMNDMWKFTPNL